MARPRADALSGALAVLGAASPVGAHLKAALADRGVPGTRVELFGRQGEVAVLSEYDGEARLVQPSTRLDPFAHAAVFVCEPVHAAEGLMSAARAGTLVVDLIGSLEGAALAGTAAADGARLVGVPHPVTMLLSAFLGPLHRALGLRGVSAFVLRPASDFGEPGLEELREQTVRLLRFESTPTDLFGRQLAFNVIPEHLAPAPEDRASARIASECQVLLGAPPVPVAISLALVPAFFGHAVAAHVETSRGDAKAALAALEEAGVSLGAADAGAVLDAPEGPGVSVARVDDLPAGGLRIWALGSEAGASAASIAVGVGHEAGVL